MSVYLTSVTTCFMMLTYSIKLSRKVTQEAILNILCFKFSRDVCCTIYVVQNSYVNYSFRHSRNSVLN